LITWGEYPSAAAQLEAALAARDDDPASWHDLGHLRLNANDTRGAIAAFERSIALAPKDLRPRKSLAATLWKTGDLAGALAQYKQMRELDLPDALRANVEWAIVAIPAIQRGETPPPPPPGSRQR
jgi:Flp pilus assembly protein TadD